MQQPSRGFRAASTPLRKKFSTHSPVLERPLHERFFIKANIMSDNP